MNNADPAGGAEARTASTFDIEGRRVVITGGTAGIGLAAAAHLARCGAQVVITGRRGDGADIAARIGAAFEPVDVADEDSVRRGFEAVAEWLGGLDALILNAGVDMFHGEVDDMDLERFGRVLDVNTMGVVRAMSHGVGLVRDHGSVIVTSSPAGEVAAPGMAAYGASKAALNQLVRVWALELGGRHVRVNGVLPGIVESEMATDSSPDVGTLSKLTANGMFRKAEEIAPVFHFLVSDASAALTGSLVGCHDGITAGFSNTVLAGLVAS